MEKKAILFQAVVPIGERRSMMNAWFKIQPTPLKISGPFHARPQPFCVGISSTFVDSVLYTIGGRVPNHFVLSDCISWLNPCHAFHRWTTRELPSPFVDSVLGVYQESLYILPGVWKYGPYHMDENTYLTTRKGYIWSTTNAKVTKIIEPPTGRWNRIRACAALDEGLLIAMDGEKNNFFLYKQENNVWEIYNIDNPLPKFIGETSFAASNGRLYILEVPAKYPAFLYIYDIKERKLVIDKKRLEFDDDLWSMDKWDRVVRIVPVTDDELCFLWLGPVSYENENGWPPVRTLHYLKFKVSICSDEQIKVVDNKVFHTNITDLLDCLPCDLNLFGTKAELPATTMAAKENTILFQTVVPFGGEELMTSAWFKIESPHKIVGPFHVRQPFRSETSSTFVGSYLYTIGGEVPSNRLRKSGSISWLDTRSPFNGWEVGELPSPCDDPVICVYGDSLYILAAPESYIWNTRVNECLETRILPPKVEGGERQWGSIRACVALDGQGLLIAMDGEKNNFFLYKPEENDWEICEFEDPLPKFSGKTSFTASNRRLYIFEVQVKSPAKLYIYDITKGKLVKDKMPILKPAYDLWPFYKMLDMVVCHLVPVANDKLCFLSLFHFPPFSGYEHREAYLLYYLKFKFSFNRNPSNSEVGFESCIEDLAVFFIPNFIKLLGCLPGGPEQFRAEVEGKSPLDYLLTQLADPFHEQEEPKITAEPETEPSREYSHSRGKNILEITAADKEMLDNRRAIKLAANRRFKDKMISKREQSEQKGELSEQMREQSEQMREQLEQVREQREQLEQQFEQKQSDKMREQIKQREQLFFEQLFVKKMCERSDKMREQIEQVLMGKRLRRLEREQTEQALMGKQLRRLKQMREHLEQMREQSEQMGEQLEQMLMCKQSEQKGELLEHIREQSEQMREQSEQMLEQMLWREYSQQMLEYTLEQKLRREQSEQMPRREQLEQMLTEMLRSGREQLEQMPRREQLEQRRREHLEQMLTEMRRSDREQLEQMRRREQLEQMLTEMLWSEQFEQMQLEQMHERLGQMREQLEQQREQLDREQLFFKRIYSQLEQQLEQLE